MSVLKYITKDVIKTVTNIAQKDAKEGWQVNPNPKVVEGIFKGLIRLISHLSNFLPWDFGVL